MIRFYHVRQVFPHLHRRSRQKVPHLRPDTRHPVPLQHRSIPDDARDCAARAGRNGHDAVGAHPSLGEGPEKVNAPYQCKGGNTCGKADVLRSAEEQTLPCPCKRFL